MMRWLLMGLMLVAASQVQAGSKETAAAQAAWEEECGSCHLAYPARFMGADAWKRLMAGLDRHFGDNASLEPEVTRQITAYLVRNASSRGNHASATTRISDTSWFVREHHEVSRQAWTSPTVKSPANCAACHINASQGDWSERGIRMPPGTRGAGREDDDDDDD